jgi:hypothetical protein
VWDVCNAGGSAFREQLEPTWSMRSRTSA